MIRRPRLRRLKSRQGGWGETLRFALLLFIIGFAVRSFAAVPYFIPSESMLPRLLVGDYLIVAKWPYGYSRHSMPFSPPLWSGRILEGVPERGDVVVFKAPPGNHEDYIKRVIGLPGDDVRMRGGVLYINNQAVPQTRIADLVIPMSPNTECHSDGIAAGYGRAFTSDGAEVCRLPRFRETLPGGRSYEIVDQGLTTLDDTETFTVPPGHYFLMGDNRDASADSRLPAVPGGGIGFVPAENLQGRALVTFFSTDGSAEWLKPWTWFSAARPERIGERF